MPKLTICFPDHQHERLKILAAVRGICFNKLFGAFSINAIAEFDTETRFRIRASRGEKALGLKIVDEFEARHSEAASRI